MKITTPARQLTIYVGASDQWHGQHLATAILERAHKEGLAGGTMTPGTAGFGAQATVHAATLVDLSGTRPIVVELIDIEDRINLFLLVLDEMLTEALVVVRDCQVVRYVH